MGHDDDKIDAVLVSGQCWQKSRHSLKAECITTEQHKQ